MNGQPPSPAWPRPPHCLTAADLALPPNGARVTGGRVQSFTAYSATGSTVAGLAAEEDAGLRLMRILADQIVARLIAASASLP